MSELDSHSPLKSESSFDIVQNYFLTLKSILLTPTDFFKRVPVSGGLSGPITFALVTHWIGAGIGYVLHLMDTHAGDHVAQKLMKFSSSYTGRFMGGGDSDIDSSSIANHLTQSLTQGQNALNWFWGVGGTLLDPFITLVCLVFSAFFVYIGARLFVHVGFRVPPQSEPLRFPHGVTFESALRVLAYSMAPALFADMPIFGSWLLVNWIWIPILSVIGAREIYRISPSRATVVALFPSILFLGIMAVVTGGIVLIALKMMVSTFVH